MLWAEWFTPTHRPWSHRGVFNEPPGTGVSAGPAGPGAAQWSGWALSPPGQEHMGLGCRSDCPVHPGATGPSGQGSPWGEDTPHPFPSWGLGFPKC